MRIAYVCADSGVPVFGRKGCSVHVQEVIRAMVRLRASVDLFAARLGGDPPPGLELVRVHRLSTSDAADTGSRERAALARNEELHGLLARSGPFDLVFERYSLWSFAGMVYARTAGTPGLLEVNAPLIEEQARHRSLGDRTTAELVLEIACDAAEAVVAVSDEVATAIATQSGSGRPIHVEPNGVDVLTFRPDVPPAFAAGPNTFTVGFVGTLKPWHALPTLVEAFDSFARGHRDVRLLVVGDGPGFDTLASDVADRGLRDVTHLLGAVDPAMVPSLLTSMSVGVAPYSAQSNCYFSPLKVFEYMAAGLPVVGSRLGQLRDVVQDGTTGLLCPPDDPPALAAALARLHDEPDLRARLGRAGRERVVREHSWEHVCRHLLELMDLELPNGLEAHR